MEIFRIIFLTESPVQKIPDTILNSIAESIVMELSCLFVAKRYPIDSKRSKCESASLWVRRSRQLWLKMWKLAEVIMAMGADAA